MKRKQLIIAAILLLTVSLSACTSNVDTNTSYDAAAKILTEVKTTQFFTEEKIANEDIEKILYAGVNAPSTMNTQPWHFTFCNYQSYQ